MEIKLKVGGMRCGSCAGSIREGLKNIPGVKETEVDLESKTVTVTTDGSPVKQEELKEKIEDLGFDVL